MVKIVMTYLMSKKMKTRNRKEQLTQATVRRILKSWMKTMRKRRRKMMMNSCRLPRLSVIR